MRLPPWLFVSRDSLYILTNLSPFVNAFYKKSLKTKVEFEIENIKNNIQENQEQLLKEKGKKDISCLISILLLGLITHFNIVIIISFCLVFGITIKDIYLNYKNKE